MMKRFRNIDLRIVLMIMAFLAVGWLQLPRLIDEFRVDEDFRSFYWMSKFSDGSLFPDVSTGYTLVNIFGYELPVTFHSLGYGLLFYLSSFFIEPIFFSKLLVFFLMPITLWYLYELGRAVRDRWSGFILAVGFLFVNLASSSSISLANGLQRSFSMLLLVALLYYVTQQKYGRAAIAVFVSAIFYPPVFVLVVVTWGLFVLYRFVFSTNEKQSIKRLLVEQGGIHLLMAFCLSILILLPALIPRFVQPQAQVVDEVSSLYKYILDDPNYQNRGANPFFVIFPFVGRGGLVDLGEDLVNLLIFGALGGLIYVVRGRRAFNNVPKVIWCLLAASLLMFALAWLAIWVTNSFLFYFPSRYSRVGLILFLLLFVLLNLRDFIREAPASLLQSPRRLTGLLIGIEGGILGLLIFYPSNLASIGAFNMKWLLVIAGVLFAVLGVTLVRNFPSTLPNFSVTQTPAGKVLIGGSLIIAIMGWAVYAPLITEVSYTNPSQAERTLMQFLETLPKDTLLAGTPCVLDSVQLFAKRQVLFSCERLSVPDRAIHEALAAYYSDDPQLIIDFCQTYHVDYLVVDLSTYSTEYLQQGQLFFEPYNQALLSQITAQQPFVLAHIPDEHKLFQTEDFFVVPCQALKN